MFKIGDTVLFHATDEDYECRIIEAHGDVYGEDVNLYDIRLPSGSTLRYIRENMLSQPPCDYMLLLKGGGIRRYKTRSGVRRYHANHADSVLGVACLVKEF